MSRRWIVLGTGIAAGCLVALLWRIGLVGSEGGRDPRADRAATAGADARPADSLALLEAGGERPAPRSPDSEASSASLPELYVPDFGPDLARPTARARFDLRDAHGAPLEGAVLVGAELRRKTGEGWVGHPAVLEPAESRVRCEGPGGSGLPPGEYELDLRAGPYGELREPFTLAAGVSLERTLALPRWRRILRLAIQDNLGRALARITQAPEYLYEIPGPAETPAPAIYSYLSRSRRGWEAYYETDEGAYHVRVFAGLPARIKIDVEKQRYGRDAIVLESDFSGPEWDDYPIVLEPVPGLDGLMSSWVDVNPDDPGSKSLLTAPIQPPPPRADPRDLTGMLRGRIRVIVQVDSPLPVRMISESGTPHRAGGDIVDRSLWETDDLWFMDVMLSPGDGELPTRVGFTDDFLFRDEVPLQPIRPLPEITPEMWGRTSFDYRVRLEAIPAVIDVVPPTPTLDAYARSVEIAIGSGEASSERSIAIDRDASGRFRVRTGLAPDLARELAVSARARVRFRGGDGEGFGIARTLGDGDRAALCGGALRLDGGGEGLVLRVVGADRVGVAGVAGAIVPVRQVPSAEDTLRPRAELQSDSDGYAVLDTLRLRAGDRYALFLFGPGDDPHPRRRIDFLAAAGVTDLGVIRLPLP